MSIFDRIQAESNFRLCDQIKRGIVSGQIPASVASALVSEFDPVIKVSECYNSAEVIAKSFGDEFDRFLFDQADAQDFNIKDLASCVTEARIPLSFFFRADVDDNDFLKTCIFFKQLLSIKKRGSRFYIHNLQGKKIHALRGAVILKNKEIYVPSLCQWNNRDVNLEWDPYPGDSCIEIGDLTWIKKE